MTRTVYGLRLVWGSWTSGVPTLDRVVYATEWLR